MRNWSLISFTLASELRFKILIALNKKIQTPTELAKTLHASISHVSLHLKELSDKNLVENLTPHKRKDKKFGVTSKGKELIFEIYEITDVERKLRGGAEENAKYAKMRKVTHSHYKQFIKSHDKIVIEDRIGKKEVVIKIGDKKRIKKYQPKDFELEGTNVWSYPKRGDWATHKGNYRGNWPPQMARNIILRYSKPNELVLDQMIGGGTTLVECKLLGRNGIGMDINENCVMLTKDRLNFRYTTLDYDSNDTTQKTYVGDARNLNLIEDESIDLIATHPPYANIIPYSKQKVEGDLSNVYNIDEFVKEMEKVAEESFRVLKLGKYCAILIGDTRRHKHHVPIAFRTMQAFLDIGFILKEDIIKHQWRCKSTPFWLEKSIKYNFLLLMHEHLFIFRKPMKGEKLDNYEESMRLKS